MDGSSLCSVTMKFASEGKNDYTSQSSECSKIKRSEIKQPDVVNNGLLHWKCSQRREGILILRRCTFLPGHVHKLSNKCVSKTRILFFEHCRFFPCGPLLRRVSRLGPTQRQVCARAYVPCFLTVCIPSLDRLPWHRFTLKRHLSMFNIAVRRASAVLPTQSLFRQVKSN